MHDARLAAAFAAACSIELLSTGAWAQAGTEPKVEPPDLETVTVTGSLIPTEPNAVAVPVIALDAKQLEQNGVVSNPLEILRKAIPSFAGRSNAGTSNANNDNQRTAGGSQLQLRNLPTLILINGRRVANSGVGGINGKNFVDVNQIPAAAIDHIEVLTDGASSIYGSDAIGGVVNFILKSKYDGLNFGGRYGFANGDYKERSAYVTGGTNVGPVNFTATGSYSKTSRCSRAPARSPARFMARLRRFRVWWPWARTIRVAFWRRESTRRAQPTRWGRPRPRARSANCWRTGRMLRPRRRP